MINLYEKAALWKKSFSGTSGDPIASKIKEIYATAWERACSLAKSISADACGLTLHDEKHFAALWRHASLLAPPDLRLSPVEAMLLGLAILIHDAAHTIIAYEGGLQEISSTPEWADALATRLADGEGGALPHVDQLSEQARRSVLFDTVRALHAQQATKLLDREFKHPAVPASMFIVDDPTVRAHLGSLVGEIAASHHWGVSRLETLGATRNLVSPYDEYGPVRPILIAALLRTADAIQVDSARASDFEFALAQPTGVSLDHWKAQNRLAVGPDNKDPSALRFESSRPFGEDDIGAWWVAYDLATNADNELRATDHLLQDQRLNRLLLNHVRDISTPKKFAEHVKTDGWEPISAEVKVGDTAKLIEIFGGKGLYGDNETVPLRELIQNSVDAVRARRVIDQGYRGKIRVSLIDREDSSGDRVPWLRVSDDGIGMSLSILTGPFVTFGQSGWNSAALKGERPGFIGKRFHHIGRFGIGFFSVFMIGEEVRVTTRSFDKSFDQLRTLHFHEGLGLRPTVKKASEGQADGAGTITSVEVRITDAIRAKLLHRKDKSMVYEVGKPAHERPAVSFELGKLVGMLCPAIDVELETYDARTGSTEVIAADWSTGDAQTWLCCINGMDASALPSTLADNLDLLEPIVERGVVVGRGSLNPSGKSLGVIGVGGLSNKKNENSDKGSGFIGYLDALPSGPKRVSGELVGREVVANWATDQRKGGWKET